MRSGFRQSGFSLLEMVAVITTILILAGVLLGVGKYLMVRADSDLTKSELEVLTTALQQYYADFGAFPFDTDTDIPEDGILDDYLVIDLETDLTGTVTGNLQDADASSAALFYFLDKNPSSRKIVEALSNSLVSSKDVSGTPITLTIGGQTANLPRFIDAWGTSIRYDYLDGTAFPLLTSAGPDKRFETAGDNVSSQ